MNLSPEQTRAVESISPAIIDELGDFEPTVTRPALIERLIDLATDGTIDHAFLMANDVAYYDIYKNGCIDVLVHEVGA